MAIAAAFVNSFSNSLQPLTQHSSASHSFYPPPLSFCFPKQNVGSAHLVFCSQIPSDHVANSGKWRTRASFFTGFLTNRKAVAVKTLKEELYQEVNPLDRGAEASPEDQARVDQIAQQLETINDIKEPLKSNLLNGKWELIYTTSESLLQTKRPKFLRPNGKIYQAINVDTLRAQNIETWPFFNQATANLVPLNSRRVAVKFDYFRIAGVIPIKSPGSGRGQLEITYLDEELRISRGNRGNLFILKMVDPTYKVPL
ncbi:Plastid-lipid associated protein PAP / fibrillin family protein [Melia azedarach]|uniref:Plastid-lipid associated protein PAP / fibrillin family protein n=1 Tax=Melia azedarach TaxID=155640 RepID=A0ACC1Y002_MELAZ|nr:Plastid-lipid associated protein PAP / fibrillin family protein [Melia azedarach]